MSDVRNGAALVREVALKAVDEKTGAIKAEYADQLKRVSDDFDAKLDAIKLETAKAKANVRFENMMEAKARKNALNPLLHEFIKTGSVRQEIAQKADGYVRFDAATAGSLLAQPEMAAEINRLVLDITPVLQVVDLQDINVAEFKAPVQTANVDAYWEDEAQPTTLGKDAFASVSITPFKLASRVWFSQEMLDDSQYDVEGYTMESIIEKQSQKIGSAVMSGNGVKKPQSLVSSVSGYNSGALALSFGQIIALAGQPLEGYLRANPESTGWMMARATRQLVRALAISSTAVQYAWEVDGRAGNPERLLGYPVFTAANADMANPSAAGAFTTGQRSILFGNFKRAYTVVRNRDIRIIRDPYTGSAQFIVYLNVMQRIDGRVTNDKAVFALVASGS